MAEARKLNLTVTTGTADVWRGVASELDIIADRGPMQGQGSISGLMAVLASGELDPFDFAQAFAEFKAGLREGPPPGQMELPT